MGTADAGRQFLEVLTCAGEPTDLNVASNFDTTCASVLAGALAYACREPNSIEHVLCFLP